MTIIVAGTVDFEPGSAESALNDARPFIEASLKEEGCLAYAWTLDPMTPGRVRVFEEWASQAAFAAHLQDESYWGMRRHLAGRGIRGSAVKKYRIDRAGPVYDEAGQARADFFEPSGSR